MKKTRTALVWILLVAVLAALLILRNDGERREFLPFSAFAGDVEAGEVAAVHVDGPAIAVTATDGRRYLTHGALDAEMREKLRRQGAALGYGRMDEGSSLSWLAFVVPIALLVFFLLYFLRKSRGNFGDVLSMRRSPHREVSGSESRHTFADVGGCEEAKELLADVIDFLNHPQRWMQAGARLPRGVLLEGPPGCGKTLLARAVAGETKAKFFLVSGSEFVEMFVGVGAARVRDLFETAIKQAPAVVFIDEIDALGRRRGSGIGGSHDEREQTLNQLLVCLDGFRPNDRIVVLAATNRPDVLDQALVRPGRIDRRIRIPELSEESRLEVLKIHTRGKPLDASVDLADLARRTAGLHGAQLENLTNEAALAAVRRARREASDAARITGGDFARALEAMEGQDRRFNKVDAVIIESGSQLAEPTGAARVRLTLKEAPPVEGEVVWADAAFFKIRRTDGGPDLLVAKRQVLHLEVLDGTDAAPRDGIQIDAWAARRSDSA